MALSAVSSGAKRYRCYFKLSRNDVSETLSSSLIFVDPERNELLSDPCNNFILHFLPLIICILEPSVMSRRGITLAVIFAKMTFCNVRPMITRRQHIIRL